MIGIGIPMRTKLVTMYSVVLKIQACQTGHTAQYKIAWFNSVYMTTKVSLEGSFLGFFRISEEVKKHYIKFISLAKYCIQAGSVSCMIIG